MTNTGHVHVSDFLIFIESMSFIGYQLPLSITPWLGPHQKSVNKKPKAHWDEKQTDSQRTSSHDQYEPNDLQYPRLIVSTNDRPIGNDDDKLLYANKKYEKKRRKEMRAIETDKLKINRRKTSYTNPPIIFSFVRRCMKNRTQRYNITWSVTSVTRYFYDECVSFSGSLWTRHCIRDQSNVLHTSLRCWPKL